MHNVMHGYATIFADINECFMTTDDCDDDALCTNTEGSFECTCSPGFTGDGLNCTGTILL